MLAPASNQRGLVWRDPPMNSPPHSPARTSPEPAQIAPGVPPDATQVIAPQGPTTSQGLPGYVYSYYPSSVQPAARVQFPAHLLSPLSPATTDQVLSRSTIQSAPTDQLATTVQGTELSGSKLSRQNITFSPGTEFSPPTRSLMTGTSTAGASAGTTLDSTAFRTTVTSGAITSPTSATDPLVRAGQPEEDIVLVPESREKMVVLLMSLILALISATLFTMLFKIITQRAEGGGVGLTGKG
ncbi:mucin-2-like isoform X2 [Ornithodoros turicata]|uniref:mucin-2-like isoform X2 n=1 Tax=Ornithodoros turicata TaxID=34597 RepID=UPI003139CFF5